MKRLYWARMSDGRTCVREDGQSYDEYDTCVDLVTMTFMAHIGGVELVEELCDWSAPRLIDPTED